MTPPPRHIAVIDIGKTNAKIALVDLDTRTEVAVATCPNAVLQGPPYPHFDTETLWAFILDGLRRLHASHGVDAISITTHGACAALLAADGTLAAPVLDYEHTGPDTLAAEYDAIRPEFAETGSARLPMGLNIGAQLFWQFRQDPALRDRVAHLVTWPQYWGHRLTGQYATDVTSLGCHTDLWNPYRAGFSSLVDTLGLRSRIAPPRRPADALGTLLPAIASQTGLAPQTPVASGIHDSNASLLPHLMTRTGAFSVVSTGTWVVVMTIGGAAIPLDPTRDTLVNVSADGDPVPSARFMGGREFEIIRQGRPATATPDDADRVLQHQLMLLPSVQPGSGPFPRRKMQWLPAEGAGSDAAREVALGYYLALMTAECLAMTGATGPTIVEGPFAQNAFFIDMVAAATQRPVEISATRTGTAIGAALLFAPSRSIDVRTTRASLTPRPDLAAYARAWRARINVAEPASQ